MGIIGRLFGKKGSTESGSAKKAEQLVRKGIDLCQKKKWKEAIKVLKQAVEIYPKEAKGHQVLAIAYGGIPDPANAVKHYEILKNLDSRLAKELDSNPMFQMVKRMA